MIYELRIYTPSPGRLDDLLRRFETITLERWAAHGIEVAGFWTSDAADDPAQVFYLLRWNSREHQASAWGAFQSDPLWISRRAETEKNGTLVAAIGGAFLNPTQFSPLR
jgi:heme-degrading monooxygenase HmoA